MIDRGLDKNYILGKVTISEYSPVYCTGRSGETRTPDLRHPMPARYQLRYAPNI